MARAVRRDRVGRRDEVEAERVARVLRRVERRFARFRSEGSGGRRIPPALRQEVVAAVEQGVTRGSLERTCGVSWGQVERWRAERGRPPRVEEHKVRAFAVVDVPAPEPQPRELSLRMGPWHVTVRLDEPCSR